MFANQRFKITNSVHEIISEVLFIVLVANFSNIRRKMPKHMVLGYAIRNPTLIIPLRPDSSLLTHVNASLGIRAHDVAKTAAGEPSDQRQELIDTPESPSEVHLLLRSLATLTELLNSSRGQQNWRDQVDLPDINNEATKVLIMYILEKHKDMRSGHLDTIKGPPNRIDFKPGTRPIR